MPEQVDRAMSSKEKRLMEAARLRYMEDCSNQEIADRIGLNEGTVRNYFSQEDMDRFKRFYSDMERFELERSLQQDVKDGEQLANNLLARAIQHDDADDKTYLRASEKALKIRERKLKLLQELGVIQKPKERKEVEQKSTDVTISEGVVDPDNLSEEVRERLEAKNSE